MNEDRQDDRDDRGTRDRRDDEPTTPTDQNVNTATSDGRPILPADGDGTPEVKLAPPKGVGGPKDDVVADYYKEPKGHEIGDLDAVSGGPGQALHDDLAEQVDQVGQHEALFDAPGADLLQGRDGGLPEGAGSIPGGGHDTSGRTTEQESPINLAGPGGAGGADTESLGWKPGDPKPGSSGGKAGKDESSKLVDIGSKEAGKEGANQFKATQESIKWYEKNTEPQPVGDPPPIPEEPEPVGDPPPIPEEEGPAGDPPPIPEELEVEQPAEPEYTGPSGISGVQTEAFRQEYLQSQWDAKQGGAINPNPASEAAVGEVEMLHTMDDMVTTPADPSAGSAPSIKPDGPLGAPDQPIDWGPDHTEPGTGTGPSDGMIEGDFLYNVPKLKQDQGSPPTESTESEESTAAKTTAKTAATSTTKSDDVDDDDDAEQSVQLSSEHAGATTPDEVAEPLWWQGDATTDAPVTSGGTVTGSTGGSIVVDAPPDGDPDEDSGADRSVAARLDHTATATGSPNASIAEFGAGHVAEAQPAFGRGDLAGADTMTDGVTSSIDPALAKQPGAELLHGRVEPDPQDTSTTFEVTEVPTFDDDVMTARRAGDDDEGMEYDPSLEPLD